MEIEKILEILNKVLEKNISYEDKEKIVYLSAELKKMFRKLPSSIKLEELQKIVIDLEVKYDDLNDLSYYFDPLYAKIKNAIHAECVKKIREDNRRKKVDK